MDSIPTIADGVLGTIDAGQFRKLNWEHLPMLLRSRLNGESTEAGIRKAFDHPFWVDARKGADTATKKQCQRVLDEALARVKK